MKSISKRKRNLLVIGIVLASLCTPLMAGAKGLYNNPCSGYDSQRAGHHHTGRHDDGLHKMDNLRSANLTQEQIKQLQTLRLDYEQKRLPIEANLRTLQLNIRSAVMETEIQRSTVEGLAQEVAKLQGQLYLLNVSHKLDKQAIVTVSQ